MKEQGVSDRFWYRYIKECIAILAHAFQIAGYRACMHAELYAATPHFTQISLQGLNRVSS
jgi:hypothetical protein